MKISLEDALGRLDEARFEDIDEKVANALMLVGAAYLQRGHLDQAREALDEAHYLCRKLDNPAGRAQVCLWMARVLEGQGEYQGALACLDEAAEVFADSGEHLSGRVQVLEARVRVLSAAGRPQEALPHLEEARRLAQEAGDQVALVLFEQELAGLCRRLGRREESLLAYRRLEELAASLGDHQRRALALVGVGSLEAAAGNLDDARRALGQARELYRRLGQNQLARRVAEEMSSLPGEETNQNGRHDKEED